MPCLHPVNAGRATPSTKKASLQRIFGSTFAGVFAAGLFFDPLQGAIANEARERLPETRILSLEHRLEELETRLDGQGHNRPSKSSELGL